MSIQKEIPNALRLAAEFRPSMPADVVKLWAADVAQELRAQHGLIQKLKEHQNCEPIAWTDENFMSLYVSKDIAEIEGANVELYAAPPKREPLSDEQIEQGRKQTFSTENPFCPCDSKTMRKAVRWAERAHKIGGQS